MRIFLVLFVVGLLSLPVISVRAMTSGHAETAAEADEASSGLIIAETRGMDRRDDRDDNRDDRQDDRQDRRHGENDDDEEDDDEEDDD